MSSLHTKHRPTTLDEVIGQTSVVTSLRKVLADRRAHSFLFVGPSGVGKTTLARIIANEFAGREATVANIEEIPAADLSGVDDMRNIVNRLQYRAIGASPVKAIILDECHRLSSAAWQVLLKPIEEPPDHVYWFLCSTELGKIPKTIQTRCLRYDLKLVDEVLIYELLLSIVQKEGLSAKESVLEAIAENSGGSPRQAVVNLELCASCENAGEARAAMHSAGQTREIIDICRWLVAGKALTWAEATKYIKSLEGTDAESIRIVVCNYLAAVLMGTKQDDRAARLLTMLQCFSEPYNQSDKLAPLLLSLGMAINVGG